MTGPEHPVAPSPAIVRRRARVRHIRQSVAAISAAAFIALFAVIYVQMAAGKDPALGASAVQQQSTSPSGGSSSASGRDAGAATSNFATNDSGAATSDQPAAVTTGQVVTTIVAPVVESRRETAESGDSFDCFGGRCAVQVGGRGAAEAIAAARFTLLAWHERFSRFLPDSELSRLNADPRELVPTSPLMARLAGAVVRAAKRTGGLVDATLVGEIEAAGYASHVPARRLDLAEALALAPPRRPAVGNQDARWRRIRVERRSARGGHFAIRRPPGLRIDSGGLAKGLFADVLASALVGRPSYAIVCGGDLRVGGAPRPIDVESPFDGRVLHRFELTDAGVATSGIGRRSWAGPDGAPAHHLLDPATGKPAFTGIVQATAIAPTALDAEVRAKAALLSGPAGAAAWLPDGGALVFDDGSFEVL